MKSVDELSKEEEREKILAAKREYQKNYRKKNKAKLYQQNKEWREKNPDKVKAANDRYWRKKAGLKQG